MPQGWESRVLGPPLSCPLHLGFPVCEMEIMLLHPDTEPRGLIRSVVLLGEGRFFHCISSLFFPINVLKIPRDPFHLNKAS